MKVVGLISGGKDSCFNLMKCVEDGHEIVCLANLYPPKGKGELDSYMYQTVGHDGIDLYAEAMGLPLYRGCISGQPKDLRAEYTPTQDDEVEDLYNLLMKIKCQTPFEGVSVGAIFSDYQRVRVQSICDRMGLEMLAYLWHREQSALLQAMIDSGLEAILIKVAAMGLTPEHLGLTLSQAQPLLESLGQKYGINVCGEGGEFESYVLDCPLFRKRIEVRKSTPVIHSDDAFAPVAYLKLDDLVLVDK